MELVGGSFEMIDSQIFVSAGEVLEPSQLATCKAWYELNFANGKDIANYNTSDPISSVTRLYGDASFPATLTATLTQRPIMGAGYGNGKAAIFDGSNDELRGVMNAYVPFASTGTALVVVKAAALMNNKAIWAFDAANQRLAIRYHSDQASLRFVFSSNGIATTAAIVLNISDIYTDYLFISLTRASNIWTINCNGRSASLSNASNPNIGTMNIILGFDSASGYLNGRIDMFSYFTDALSDETILKLFNRIKIK
jgi:hypothetical protein